MSDGAPSPEQLLCDTSFVAISARPRQTTSWPRATRQRIDGAILAISVITLAEARYGYLNAKWGDRRIQREERRLANFLRVPLDLAVIDEWARLKVLSRQNGWNLADNDLWIAATASARGLPLLTCDADQGRISDPQLEILHLPVAR